MKAKKIHGSFPFRQQQQQMLLEQTPNKDVGTHALPEQDAPTIVGQHATKFQEHQSKAETESLIGQSQQVPVSQAQVPAKSGSTVLSAMFTSSGFTGGGLVPKKETSATQASNQESLSGLQKAPIEFQMAEITQALKIADLSTQLETQNSVQKQAPEVQSAVQSSASETTTVGMQPVWSEVTNAELSPSLGFDSGSLLAQGKSVSSQQMLEQTQSALNGLQMQGQQLGPLGPLQESAQQLQSLPCVQEGWSPSSSQSISVPEASQFGSGLSGLLGGLGNLSLPALPSLDSLSKAGGNILQNAKDLGSRALNSLGSALGIGGSQGALNVDPSYQGPLHAPGVGSDGTKPNSDVRSAKYMDAGEIASKRAQIQEALSSDSKIRAVAADDKALALATPAEKATMIRELMSGWTTNSEDSAMVDIAESCTSREEFDMVMQMAGGIDVVNEMDNPNAKTRMNVLAGMWGCPQWANNAKEAGMAANALLDQKKADELVPLDPAQVQSFAEATPAGVEGLPANSPELAAKQQARRNAFDIHFEPSTYKSLLTINAVRRSEGKEPLDWLSLNDRALRVFEDDSISGTKRFGFLPSDKELEISKLRYKEGIGYTDMNRLFSRRYSSVFDTTNKESNSKSAVLDRCKDLAKEMFPMSSDGPFINKTTQFLSLVSGFFGKAFSVMKPTKEALPDAERAIAAHCHVMNFASKVEAQKADGTDPMASMDFQSLMQDVVATAQRSVEQATRQLAYAPNAQSMDAAMVSFQQGVDVAASASTYLAGSANNDREMAMQGLQGIAAQVGVTAGSFSEFALQGLSLGGEALSSLQEGELQGSIQQLQSQMEGIATPQSKQVQEQLQNGKFFAESMSSGAFFGACEQLLPSVQALAVSNPSMQLPVSQLESVMYFAGGVASGDAQQALTNLQGALNSTVNHPLIQEGTQALGLVGEALSQHEKPMDALHGLVEGGQLQGFLSSLHDGSLQQGIEQVAQDTQGFLGGAALQHGNYWSGALAHFCYQLQSGDLGKTLDGLGQVGLARQPAFEQLKQFVDAGQTFLEQSANGSIQQNLQQVQSTHPECQAAASSFFQQQSQFTGFVSTFAGGQVSGALQQVTQQLEHVAQAESMLQELQPLEQFTQAYLGAFETPEALAQEMLGQ